MIGPRWSNERTATRGARKHPKYINALAGVDYLVVEIRLAPRDAALYDGLHSISGTAAGYFEGLGLPPSPTHRLIFALPCVFSGT